MRVARKLPVSVAAARCLSTATTSRIEPQVASSLLQIGTRRIFEAEHDQYRELCRNFYEKKVIPFHSKWEEDGHVPRDLWLDAGKLKNTSVPRQNFIMLDF